MVTLATTGITLDLHICQGKVKSFAVNGHAESCTGMVQLGEANCMSSDAEDTESGESIQRKPCCSNSSYFFQLDEHKSSQFLLAKVYPSIEPSPITEIPLLSWNLDKPQPNGLRSKIPIPRRKIHLINQCFLI